jgi:c-di-GMP-related signal transduction protein
LLLKIWREKNYPSSFGGERAIHIFSPYLSNFIVHPKILKDRKNCTHRFEEKLKIFNCIRVSVDLNPHVTEIVYKSTISLKLLTFLTS